MKHEAAGKATGAKAAAAEEAVQRDAAEEAAYHEAEEEVQREKDVAEAVDSETNMEHDAATADEGTTPWRRRRRHRSMTPRWQSSLRSTRPQRQRRR